MSSGDAAQYLGCSLWLIHRVPKEELPYIKVGNRRRYMPEDVEAYRKVRDARS